MLAKHKVDGSKPFTRSRKPIKDQILFETGSGPLSKGKIGHQPERYSV